MKNQCKVTISKKNLTSGEQAITISIKDSISSVNIIEVGLTMEDFSQCLTGLAYSPAKYYYLVPEENVKNIGKVKLLKDMKVDVSGLTYSDEKESRVWDDFENGPEYRDGWMIWDDGTTTQQNGKLHNYSIYKYVTYDEAIELEKQEDKDFRVCLPLEIKRKINETEKDQKVT